MGTIDWDGELRRLGGVVDRAWGKDEDTVRKAVEKVEDIIYKTLGQLGDQPFIDWATKSAGFHDFDQAGVAGDRHWSWLKKFRRPKGAFANP